MENKKRHKFTKEEKQFIYDNVNGISVNKLLEIFNKKFKTNITNTQIQQFKERNKLLSGTQHHFTDKQKKFIIDNINKYFVSDLVVLFNKKFKTNITKKQISEFKYRNKLYSGLKWRNGKPTHIPIGTEYLTSGGTMMIKVSNNKENPKLQWTTRARYNYENKYGKIPKGYELMHLDGNRLNDDLDNLKLVKKGVVQAINIQQLRSDNILFNKAAIKIVELQMYKNKLKKQVI